MKKLFSNRSKVHGNMKSFAGLQKNDVSRWVIESFASSGSNDVWTLQCFMMAVFNALMFPTSVLNINGSDFLYCKEIMHLGVFDWCQAVVDDIRDKVDRWRKNRDKATPLVQGCIAFIMLRESNGSCYANIGGDGPGGQGHVLESRTTSAGFLYGKAAGVVNIPLLLKLRGTILLLKKKDLNLMINIGVPPDANANTKRSKTKPQSASKMIEHRHIPHGFLHFQPLLRGLGDYLFDGQQKREFLAALELHDKDVDAAIIKMNEAHKDIEEAQQKIVSEIKHIFGDLVGSSLNTESPRDVRHKRRAERPLGASSLNVKRKSQIPREIVVERSPQLSAEQSSFEQQEAAHAPDDTHVQHEVQQTVTVESVQEEVTHAALHTTVQHEATKLGVDARAQQEILPPATATPIQHEPIQPAATTFEHDEVELPAADTTNEVIRESDTCAQRSSVFDGDFNYEDWNEVGNILRELNEDPTQVSLRKEYDIKEAAALTGEKEKAKKIISVGKLKSNTKKSTPAGVSQYIDVPKQVLVNDCGFFVMLFLEHYDGEHRKFDVPIIPERGTQYRAELMYYMFFHKMNEARGHLLNCTQQIIDSSDAMKDGVASCDVEKDDVASYDEQKDVARTNLE
ncbi:hypothetical protein GUJ93_ZPchr0007g4011 [Zizania palustris]|uniref:Ubiquitin-like protease family profile domain-containing protein n=1 Tax=Zizania palustris TaxID=103762 RepID=A0A8J5TGM0_ZIZPA|nr:hypothetical protein GUJ93_ZPchr0007g4011 [Zizania palustris]